MSPWGHSYFMSSSPSKREAKLKVKTLLQRKLSSVLNIKVCFKTISECLECLRLCHFLLK